MPLPIARKPEGFSFKEFLFFSSLARGRIGVFAFGYFVSFAVKLFRFRPSSFVKGDELTGTTNTTDTTDTLNLFFSESYNSRHECDETFAAGRSCRRSGGGTGSRCS
jgi:hypothetical protein